MQALFLRLVNMSITASWLVLAVLLLRLAFRRAPRWILCALWGLVALRLVFPFSIESVLSLIPTSEPLPPEIIYTATPEIHSGVAPSGGIVDPILSGTLATPQTPIASANRTQIWSFIFSHVWLTGMAAMVLYAVVSYLLLKRRMRTATVLRDNIVQSSQVGSPFVLGILRPRIYLPYSLEGADMDHVIAHEQAHIRRRDHWWKPLGFLLLSVYWFNPAMWLAYVLLCRDIEAACDEKVIAAMDQEDRRAYSTALLNCAVHRRRIAACPLAFGETGVKGRVKSVMNYKKPAFWIVVLAVAASIAAAVCLLTDPADRAEDPPPVQTGTYTLAGAIYENPFSPDLDLPACYRLEDMRLLYLEYDGLENAWVELGALTETELTGDSFDGLFSDNTECWAEGLSAAILRRDHARAWELVNGDRLYYLLQQEDGSLYLARGYYDAAEKDDPYSDDTNLQHLHRLSLSTTADGTPIPATLTLEHVIELSKKGEALTWSDVDQFPYRVVGSGLYIRAYEIDGRFRLAVTGPWPGPGEWTNSGFSAASSVGTADSADTPIPDEYIHTGTVEMSVLMGFRLGFKLIPGDSIDIRYEDVQAFIDQKLAQWDAFLAENDPISYDRLFLTFSSGAGDWANVLTLHPDGSFFGTYWGTDPAEIGVSHPSRVYVCDFTGRFTSIRRLDENTWSMTLSELAAERPEGEIGFDGDTHYVAVPPYGLEGGTEFILYAPETPADGLSTQFLAWWPDASLWRQGQQETLSRYGLYNVDTGHGFFSYRYGDPPAEDGSTRSEIPDPADLPGETLVFHHNELQIQVTNVLGVRVEKMLAEGLQPHEYTVYTCHPGATVTILRAGMDDPTWNEDGLPHPDYGLLYTNERERTRITSDMEGLPLPLSSDLEGVYHLEGSLFVLAFEIEDGGS